MPIDGFPRRRATFDNALAESVTHQLVIDLRDGPASPEELRKVGEALREVLGDRVVGFPKQVPRKHRDPLEGMRSADCELIAHDPRYSGLVPKQKHAEVLKKLGKDPDEPPPGYGLATFRERVLKISPKESNF
jgi:hypothetical protein